MKFLTTVKRVMDPDARVKIKPDGSAIVTAGISHKINSFDEYGIEEAIRLKEKHGGEVVAVSVGSNEAIKELRSALALGADRAILIQIDSEEENLQLLDSDAVARLLAEVVRKEEPDAILMGKQSVDFDCNQTAQLLAAYLDYPQATFAYDVELDNGWATVKREVDGGMETKKVRLPAVITADLRLNEPRYAALPNIMKAKKKPLETLTPEDLGVDIAPKVSVVKYELPAERHAGQMLDSVDDLVGQLKNDAKVI